MIDGILLEGVTGAGKTQTLRALRSRPDFPALLREGWVFVEDEILGEFMDELRDASINPSRRHRRLHQVLEELRRAANARREYGYVLERFHPSYYALAPDWDLFAVIDAELVALRCKVVFLSIPPERLAARGLDRIDRKDSDWSAGMIAYFGSRQSALDAMEASQARRCACLARSALPRLEIDTTAMNWRACAEEVARFWRHRAFP